MAHVLNKITGAPLEAVRKQLEIDREQHVAQGMILEHLWTNAANPDEVFFLFRVDDLDKCKREAEQVYAEARRRDPNVKLPEKTYLADA